MDQVPGNYMAQNWFASQFVAGNMPVQRFRVASGETHLLLNAIANDDWNALGLKGSHPHYQVVDNVGEHWADVHVSGNIIEVDTSPARRASRPDVAEAVFWIRFAGTMYHLCNVTPV